MHVTPQLHGVTNSVSAIVVALDLLERVLAGVSLPPADRCAVDACLREMNESVKLLRSLVVSGEAVRGRERR